MIAYLFDSTGSCYNVYSVESIYIKANILQVLPDTVFFVHCIVLEFGLNVIGYIGRTERLDELEGNWPDVFEIVVSPITVLRQ